MRRDGRGAGAAAVREVGERKCDSLLPTSVAQPGQERNVEVHCLQCHIRITDGIGDRPDEKKDARGRTRLEVFDACQCKEKDVRPARPLHQRIHGPAADEADHGVDDLKAREELEVAKLQVTACTGIYRLGFRRCLERARWPSSAGVRPLTSAPPLENAARKPGRAEFRASSAHVAPLRSLPVNGLRLPTAWLQVARHNLK